MIYKIALNEKQPEEFVKAKFKAEYERKYSKSIDSVGGLERFYVRCVAIPEISKVGLRRITKFLGPNKPYEDMADFVTGSSFPSSSQVPAIANMKEWRSEGEGGDGSWFKGLSNPGYVDDIEIEYCERPEIPRHRRKRCMLILMPPDITEEAPF